VAAGERRPERLGHRVDRRADAVGEILDGRGEEAVPGHHEQHEREYPPAPGPQGLGGDEGEEGDDVAEGDDAGCMNKIALLLQPPKAERKPPAAADN